MPSDRFAVKLILDKSGEMIYFSQLDLFHLLARALRRSGLPLYFTEGFTRRVKISFQNGLKLGLAGKIEVTFYFTEEISPLEVANRIKQQLPAGLDIIQNT